MPNLASMSILPFSVLALVFVLFILVIYLWLALNNREERISILEEDHKKMIRSFNELDEQAKLIVKTDLELNKAQEELDKRLNGLNALQRTSRQINQAFNEKEIFDKLESSLFENLGFSKALVIVNDEKHNPKPRAQVGFDGSKMRQTLDNLFKDDLIKNRLNEGITLSSVNSPRKIKEIMALVFEMEHYVLAPIITQMGMLGFVFVGNRYDAPAITPGDEELIAILAGQIGQAIENAQLFDKVFRSSQELEVKVKDRTKQLATALSQVEEINRKKSEFISAVSHELRTPLTSIKGYAAILMAGKIGAVPDAVKERLAKINTHSDNLVNLINNLLDIARIESGRVDMQFGAYKIKSVINNIVDLLNPQVTTKEIILKTDIAPEVSEIYIDTSQAERVFINLLSNAVKFTPKGGNIMLSVQLASDKEFALFKVNDSGIGMSAADLEKLFSEFFRAENEINQAVKGTGLGLVLAKEIVIAHHGKIWVNSQLGKGTTFYFTLPINKETFDKYKKVTPLT